MASSALAPRIPGAPGHVHSDAAWGVILVIPYIVVFIFVVVYPILYGLVLGSNPDSYRKIFNDPIYFRSAWNTLVFLIVAVNLKLLLALFLSGFFYNTEAWIRWVGILFLLPWAAPGLPAIFSIRWMFNSEWGMINNLLFRLFGIDGPLWLVKPDLAFLLVILTHIWKFLPFWTLILLAGRMAIPKDHYEAASVDGATRFQVFRFITFPALKNLYITSTLLSTIWSVGDFNSVYLLTGGGPTDSTHVFSTLGIRYAFNIGDIRTGVATVITSLPLVVPIVFVLIRRLRRRE
ncbi:MAG: sugar ABC transporter permease [Syntrophaceae bacterium]|jgi:multiple sugar transport system permease protein|nr:sugar ABC transporter permease [Syntrophaceae bacterium]